jgi:NAD(P)-dependent dehydrogenase (short-subunit alcohol dehydrogenase family)
LGRVALVTGGTGALGGAVTRRLLEDGHRVAVTCVHDGEVESLRAELGEAGSGLVVVKADVTDERSVGRAVAEVRGQLGAVEVLVHLVGGWHGGESVHDHSLETWQRIVDLNLTSAFLSCRAVLPEMLEASWGRVVLVSSRTAKEGRVGQCAYAVAKEGVATLAEVIAEECCGSGVTANVIAPSVLDTPANRRAMPSADVTRWVSPDVAAAMVAFLVSDEAGTLRGAWLPVFGSA